MSERLRIGVVGLGRLWEARHRPALAGLKFDVEVAAVYDQVAQRAFNEARAIGCRPATSLTELVSAPDVDAVYLLSPQWFGLHPLELCCAHGKAVYCALDWASQRADLMQAEPRIRASAISFMPEMPRRFHPATLRLQELLATELGAPRLMVGHTRLEAFDRYADPGPNTQLVQTRLAFDPGGNLIDWCRFLFRQDIASINWTSHFVRHSRNEPAGPDSQTLSLQFAGGAAAELGIARYHRDAWGTADQFLPKPGFQVFAERGAAWLELPHRIVWCTSNGGIHDERLPPEPSIGERLNVHFLSIIRGEAPAEPSLDDALAVCRLLDGPARPQ